MQDPASELPRIRLLRTLVNSLGAELFDNILIGEHARTCVQGYRAHGAPAKVVRRMSQESDRENKVRSFDLTHHETMEELRALPDAEIERRHDAVMQSLSDDSIGDLERQIRIGRAHAYRAILEHRQSTRQGQRMEALTRSMNRLTWVVVLATILGVGMTVWVILSGN
jgi:hypothetical protein